MRDKSDLLLRDEYGRRFAILRMAEMLAPEALGGDGAFEIRIEQGIAEWDDLAERRIEDGRTFDHRWQVKRQSTPLDRGTFEKLIRAMSGTDFVAHLGLQDLVEVQGIGELRILRDLCNDRLRGGGVYTGNLDFADLEQSLTKDERVWVDAIGRVLGAANERADTWALLRRLHIDILYDAEDLERRARLCLRHIFADPKAAWESLHAHVSAHTYGHFRFTAKGLREGPLRDHALKQILAETPFDLADYLAKLPSWLQGQGARIETGLTIDGRLVEFDDICSRLTERQAVIITGSSGCGKTMLLRALAHELGAQGVVPVVAEAKSFDDDLMIWLDQSVVPDREDAFRALRHAALAENRRVVLLIDGLEEATGRATRLIGALNRSSIVDSCSIVVASRKRPGWILSIPVFEVVILLPDAAAKQRLFARHSTGRETHPARAAALLEGLTAPIEVELAAKAMSDLPDHCTKYQLFDSYARCTLHEEVGEESVAPILRLLVDVARWMADRFGTTMGISKLRTLSEKERAPSCPDPLTMALRGGLLVERVGAASFRHEQFRLFFEARGLLFEHVNDMATLARLMERPRFRELREWILGALDDADDAEVFIRRCTDSDLLLRVLQGQVGRLAERITDCVAIETITMIREEWGHLPVAVEPEQIETCHSLLRSWSPHENALMCAVGRMLPAGRFWEHVIPALQTLDRWWMSLRIPEDVDSRQIYDRVLGSLYMSGDARLLISSAHSTRWELANDTLLASLEVAVLPILQDPSQWTPGVFILIAELVPWRRPVFRAHFLKWFDACWKSGLYHVRLYAAESLPSTAMELEEPSRQTLIQQLVRIWEQSHVIAGPMDYILHTLILLGVIKDPSEEYERVALGEIRCALVEHETDESCVAAYWVFEKQFEDHIGSAYLEAIQAIDAEERRLLLCRAAKGAYQSQWGEPQIILEELFIDGGAQAGEAFLCWARLPLRETLFCHSGARAFVLANAGLGRLRHADIDAGPLPDLPVDRLWYWAGAIIRHVHVPNVELASSVLRLLWVHIRQENAWMVLEMLSQIFDACQFSSRRRSHICDLTELFPDDVVSVAVKALSGGISDELRQQHRSVRGPALDPVSYALFAFEKFGDRRHLRLLEKIVNDSDWGTDVIDAIRAIRIRETAS